MNWMMMLRRKCIISFIICLWINFVWGVSDTCDLKNVAASYNLKLTSWWNKVQLNNKKHAISFTVGSKEAVIDGTKVYLTYPLEPKVVGSHGVRLIYKKPLSLKKCYHISHVDVTKIIKPLLSPINIAKKTPKIIVIDAGHGGKAEGAINKALKLKEKDLTLKTAKKLATKFRLAGYTVYLTRENDVDLSLEDRGTFANSKKADIFISIHYNSVDPNNANVKNIGGIEIFAYTFHMHPSTERNTLNDSDRVYAQVNKFDDASTYLAWNIQTKLWKILKLKDRGVKRGRMRVLKDLKCPGVLVECGFLSNPNEAALLNSESYQNKLVQAIFNGVKAYSKN